MVDPVINRVEMKVQPERPNGKEASFKVGSKRQSIWKWTEGGVSNIKDLIPEKRKNVQSRSQSERLQEKYFCLQCLEISLRGMREERFASLCRIDQSSLKRHKARWHNTEETCCCTVVPSTAAEVKALRNRYTKSSALGKGTLSSTPSVPPAVTTVTAASSTSVNKPERPVCEVQDPKESIPVTKSPSSNQTTMLSYSAGFTEANSSPKEVTLTTVTEAISSLSLKVDNFGKHHATLEQLVFEDDDVRKGVLAMKEAKNILQLAEVSEFLQFFYDEESETAVLRCLPCFKMHLAARPALTDLSPFQAQRIINTSSNGRLATGILLNKETTRHPDRRAKPNLV